MYRGRLWTRIVPCVLALLLAPASAFAVSTGTYILSNHPDGNVSPPPYGLRLDGLLTGNSNEEYTFDFNHASSDMKLNWNGSTIHIFGTSFGGEDAGAGTYVGGTTATWTIDFTYNVGVSTSANGGMDDVIVTANHQNFGTLSSSKGSFALRDHADSGGISFNFGDEGGSGHRGFSGISGWGWLDHCKETTPGTCANNWTPSHITASDWLFTAAPVPVPAAVWLFGSGLIGLAGVARRRKTS